jgi:tRNA uridine 5-carboxymethylaminomethyl modification enzyme
MDREGIFFIIKGIDFVGPEPNLKLSISKLLSFKNTPLEDIEHIWKEDFQIENLIKNHIQIECAYKNYIEDTNKEIEKMKKEHMNLDITDINYEELKLALKREVWEKLFQHRPKTIHAASRISGVTLPSLLIIIQHQRKNKSQNKELKQKNNGNI